MSLQIRYTPSGLSANTVDMDNLSARLVRFQGYPVTDSARSVSSGGKHVAVVHDTYWVYDVEFRSIVFPDSGGTSESEWTNFIGLTSHIRQGGEFSFRKDSTKVADTTLTGAAAQFDTTINVAAITSMSDNDWLFIEDADDPNIWQKTIINGTPNVALPVRGMRFAFASGSVVRSHEYLPKCVVLDNRSAPIERRAGNGAFVYDWSFQLRTVR